MMPFRSIPTLVIVSVLLALSGAGQGHCSPVPTDPAQDFTQQLLKIAAEPPDRCDPQSNKDEDDAKTESSVFGDAVEIIVAELNTTPASPEPVLDRAIEALKKLEQTSAEINVAWPDVDRFHFQILDVSPALVLKVTFRTRARFFVLGVPEGRQWNPNRLWRQVGYDEESIEHEAVAVSIVLYPLHRGPSGNARFLAGFDYVGCAGNSMGVAYDVREWNPKSGGNLEQIIKQEGAFGIDEPADGRKPTPKDPFAPIGVLQTQGSPISLPYCWFSAIDTWDNPSMCAVDSYDLSKDDIKFRSRSYNRPDLLPIAKAIEYAEKRDYPAVLGYCASDEVAQGLVRDVPLFVFAGDLQVTRKGDGKEHVEMDGYRFDVEKRAGRWLVAAFSSQ